MNTSSKNLFRNLRLEIFPSSLYFSDNSLMMYLAPMLRGQAVILMVKMLKYLKGSNHIYINRGEGGQGCGGTQRIIRGYTFITLEIQSQIT